MLVGLMMGSVVGGCFPYRDYHSDGRYQSQSSHYQPLSNAIARPLIASSSTRSTNAPTLPAGSSLSRKVVQWAFSSSFC